MSDPRGTPGKTTVAPDVLLSIARLTTMQVEGVSQLAAVQGGMRGLLRRNTAPGVHIVIEESKVHADIYVILHQDVNIRQVSRNIQHEVARALTEMVGMEVGRVNIHIEDIDYAAEVES
jgi:uncharacterized alkaline shock family protein YloU